MPKILHARGHLAPLRVFIAIPAYDGSVSAETAGSLLAATHGMAWQVCIETGNCHVDDCRNSLVQQFLETDAEYLFFIDADGGFHHEAIDMLLYYELEVIGGVLPKKQDDSFAVRELESREPNEDGLVEVAGVGTAFLCIRRDVIEKLIEAHKDRAYTSGGRILYPLFERKTFHGERLSGDLAFCQKWRDMGGKVLVDPTLWFSHVGLKTWCGSVLDHWNKQDGRVSMRLQAAIELLMEGDTSDSTFEALYRGYGSDFAAYPDMLCALYRMARRASVIVETGSGLTTLVMAIAGAEIHSLESDLMYQKKTKALLEHFGLKANVHYSPLKDYGDHIWYDAPELPKPDLVVCDGPRREYGRDGIFSHLPMKEADWIFDDCDSLESPDHDIHILGTEGLKKFALGLRK